MARKRYEVTVHFTYKDGTPGGLLSKVVTSKKTIDVQVEANRKWLAAKGHTIGDIVVSEVCDGVVNDNLFEV